MYIKERFDNLGVKVDWKRFEEVSRLRNNIEHYYSTSPITVTNEIISKSFLLIRNFIEFELKLDAIEILGADCWSTLLDTSEVYEKEKLVCRSVINDTSWLYATLADIANNARCPECSSDLVKPAADNTTETQDSYISMQCRSCSHIFDLNEVLDEALEECLYSEMYLAHTKGGGFPYDTCPDCGRETFVYEENACMACDYSAPHEEYPS